MYDLTFIYNYADDCDNEFTLEVEGSFEVSDLPSHVEVMEDAQQVCLGDCIEIWAEVSRKSEHVQLRLEQMDCPILRVRTWFAQAQQRLIL